MNQRPILGAALAIPSLLHLPVYTEEVIMNLIWRAAERTKRWHILKILRLYESLHAGPFLFTFFLSHSEYSKTKAASTTCS